jgi:hypothetical protein
MHWHFTRTLYSGLFIWGGKGIRAFIKFNGSSADAVLPPPLYFPVVKFDTRFGLVGCFFIIPESSCCDDQSDWFSWELGLNFLVTAGSCIHMVFTAQCHIG